MKLSPKIGRDHPHVDRQGVVLISVIQVAETAERLIDVGPDLIIMKLIGPERDAVEADELPGLFTAALAAASRNPALYRAAAAHWTETLRRMAREIVKAEIRPSILRAISDDERRLRIRVAVALLACWQVRWGEPVIPPEPDDPFEEDDHRESATFARGLIDRFAAEGYDGLIKLLVESDAADLAIVAYWFMLAAGVETETGRDALRSRFDDLAGDDEVR